MLNQIAAIHGTGVPPVTNSYESIATVTVGAGGSSSISFSSIPSTFKHLQIRYISRNTSINSFANLVNAQFNGDTGSNYYQRHRLNGRGDGLVYADAGGSATNCMVGYIAGGGCTANLFTPGVVDILDYASSNKNKVIRGLTGLAGQATSTENDVALFSSMWFPSTPTAITSISLTSSSNDFAQYSQFALYGIKG